jgi:hypothetical protein
MRHSSRRGASPYERVRVRENRVEPYWKQSFVGYMQGAAGIGSMMLRLASHGTPSQWKVRLPDAPSIAALLQRDQRPTATRI